MRLECLDRGLAFSLVTGFFISAQKSGHAKLLVGLRAVACLTRSLYIEAKNGFARSVSTGDHRVFGGCHFWGVAV